MAMGEHNHVPALCMGEGNGWVDVPSHVMQTLAEWGSANIVSRGAATSWLVDKLELFANRPEDCAVHVCRESDIRSVIYVFDSRYTPAVMCYFVTVPHCGHRIHMRAKMR